MRVPTRVPMRVPVSILTIPVSKISNSKKTNYGHYFSAKNVNVVITVFCPIYVLSGKTEKTGSNLNFSRKILTLLKDWKPT
jgi:hypothetical protein